MPNFSWITPSCIDLVYYALNFSNDAAHSVPCISKVSRIPPSSVDLVCAQFFKLRCSVWTRYAYFFLDYTIFCRLGMRSIYPITLLLVDPVCRFLLDYTLFCRLGMRQFFSSYTAPCGPGMWSIFPITLLLLLYDLFHYLHLLSPRKLCGSIQESGQ